MLYESKELVWNRQFNEIITNLNKCTALNEVKNITYNDSKIEVFTKPNKLTSANINTANTLITYQASCTVPNQ